MPQTVTVKGVGDFDFPDSMSQDQIATVLRQKFPPRQDPQALGSIERGMSRDIGDRLVLNPNIASEAMASPLMQGVAAISEGTGPDIARGAHGILKAAGEGAAPVALPAGLITAPAATVLGAGGAAAAGSLAHHALADSPEYQDIGTDAAGILGGGIGGKVGQKISDLIDILPSLKSILAHPDVQKAAINILPKGKEIGAFRKILSDVSDSVSEQRAASARDAAAAAHRAANPPVALDPNYSSAAPVQGPVNPIVPSAATNRAMGPQGPPPAIRPAGPTLGNSAPPVQGPIEPIYQGLPSGRQVGGPKNVPAETKDLFDRTQTGEYHPTAETKAAEPAPPKELTSPEFENRAGVAARAAAVAKKGDMFKTSAEFDSTAGQTKLQKIAQQQGISRAKDGGYKKFSPETIEGIRARLFPGSSDEPISQSSSNDLETDYSNLLQESLARLKKK